MDNVIALLNFISTLIPVPHFLLLVSLSSIYLISHMVNVDDDWIRKVKHYSLIFLFIAIILSPVSYVLNPKKITIVVKNGQNPISGATVEIVDLKIKETTDNNGTAIIKTLNKDRSYSIKIEKQGYSSYVDALEERTIKVQLNPILDKVVFSKPDKKYDVSEIKGIPVKVEFRDYFNNPFYITSPKDNIKLSINYQPIKLDFNGSKKVSDIEYFLKYTKENYPLQDHKLQLLIHPNVEEERTFSTFRHFDFDNSDIICFDNSNPNVKIGQNGVNFYYGHSCFSSCLRIPDYKLSFKKPFSLILFTKFYHKNSSLMVLIDRYYRLLIGEGNLRNVVLQYNQALNFPADWITIREGELENAIQLNSVVDLMITHEPTIDKNMVIESKLDINALFIPKGYTRNIYSELTFTFGKERHKDLKIENWNLSLGGIAYTRKKIKCLNLWNIKISNSIL